MSLQSVILLLALILLTFAGLTGCSLNRAATDDAMPMNADVVRSATVGNLAPDFEMAQLDGTSVSFADIQGEPAVLVFWTAWCPSCKEEAPEINKLVAEFGGKGVRVLGINIGEGEARVREGIKDFGIEYDVVRDADTTVAKRYGVVGTPTIVFLDREGITRYAGNELPANYADRLKELTTQN